MSFYNVKEFNLKEETAQAEINSAVNKKVREGKPNENIEIFSKILFGKDTSKYGKKVDDVFNYVKEVSGAASEGDAKAKTEINSIVTVTLQQPLMQRLNIANFMGNSRTVGYNEQLNVEYYQIQGADLARIQASSGAFTFPTVKKRTKTVETQNATAGMAIDYRELASGATDGMAVASEQVLTSLTNQVVLSHINALRTGIQNATTLKNYEAGITKTTIDSVKNKARRFGNVTIMGDFDAVDKLSGLAGFNVNSTTNVNEVRFSEAVMEEIMSTGLLKNWKGTPVVEIPNAYNMTALNTAGDFYKPYLPTSDLWFIPQGQMTPLQIVMRGGLTSMTATDINSRSEVTRFDVEYGNYLVKEYLPFIGYIYDNTLDE
jgi:hypothetical protein